MSDETKDAGGAQTTSDPLSVKTLIERLVEAEAALTAATGGKIDSVVLPAGQTYLLREAQQAMLASEALLRAVCEGAPDFIYLIGLDWRIQYSNRGITGVPRGAEIGSDYLSHVLPENRVQMRALLEAVVATGEPQAFVGYGISAGTQTAYYSRRFSPVHVGGRLVGVALVARDMTDAKAAEAQLLVSDRMASVGTLAAGVAHEINNPLSAVISNLEIAAEDLRSLASTTPVSQDLLDEIDDARTAANRVRIVVRDLKLFSRAEDDKREAVDVERVMESTLRMAWNEIRHRARLVKDYSPVPVVMANESRLGQVFLNLVMNAAQAIPEGNAEGNRIRVLTSLDSKQRVMITISDTGPGIPPEVQRRLFTPFFTTKAVGVGTGLGLSICQRIVTAFGGEISFTSEVGKGTEFRVCLPAVSGDESEDTEESVNVVRAVRRGQILIVDDDAAVSRMVKRVLGGEHDAVAVDAAGRGLELIQRGERFDVILCDLMMPQVTGMEFYEQVARIDKAQAARFIFMTGGVFSTRARQFLDSVTNHRIEKPFDNQAVRAIVNGLIR